MNTTPYKIKFKSKLSKIIPKTKPYYMCCICLEESKDVIKCSKCVEGIICRKCRSKLEEEQRSLCPICRQESDDFIIDIKDNILPNVSINVRVSNYQKKCECSLSQIVDYCRIILYLMCFLIVSFLVGMLILQGIFNLTGTIENLGVFYFIILTIVGIGFNILLCFCCNRFMISIDE